MNPDTHRQQLLFLWTADSNLDAKVVAWTFHDGTDPSADMADAPYDRGVDALRDGWRLVQAAPLTNRPAGDEHQHGVLEFEWMFERIAPLHRAPAPD